MRNEAQREWQDRTMSSENNNSRCSDEEYARRIQAQFDAEAAEAGAARPYNNQSKKRDHVNFKDYDSSDSDSSVECLGVSNNNDNNNSKLPNVKSMKIKDIKREIESYGLSTKLIIEKDHLIKTLLDARRRGLRVVNSDDPSVDNNKNSSDSNKNNVSDGMADYRSAAKRRYEATRQQNSIINNTSTNYGGGGTHHQQKQPFIPFYLYETLESQSLPVNDPRKKYFKTLRQVVGIDYQNYDGSSSSTTMIQQRKFQWLFIFNFLINFQYLLQQLAPDILQFHRVVVFYGSAQGTEPFMQQWKQLLNGTGNTVEFHYLVPGDPPNTLTNPLPHKFPYGVHHTKMFLMGYEEDGKSHCRVAISTANLEPTESQTNAVYCQDFPLKDKKKKSSDDDKKPAAVVINPYLKRKRVESSGDEEDEEDTSEFEEDMVTYLETYYYRTRQTYCAPSLSSSSTSSNNNTNRLSTKPMSWLQLIRQYDYSNAYVVLVPSSPGRHKRNEYDNFGYLKLRKAIVKYVCPYQQSTSPKAPIFQFSSLGSISAKWLGNFLSAVDSTMTQNVNPIATHERKKKIKLPLPVKLVLPTMDEIRTSVCGYRGGGPIPFRTKNVDKEFLQPLFHRWSHRQRNNTNDPLRTKHHAPHIKTFLQPSSTNDNSIEWLVLTSHNLSTTAWGQLQLRSVQSRTDEKILYIQHWELGVFMSSKTLAKIMSPDEGGSDIRIVPYPGINQNAVINIDSDDDDEEEEGESETPKVIVPLPFDINPVPYDNNDVAWAVDRHSNVPDRFGMTV